MTSPTKPPPPRDSQAREGARGVLGLVEVWRERRQRARKRRDRIANREKVVERVLARAARLLAQEQDGYTIGPQDLAPIETLSKVVAVATPPTDAHRPLRWGAVALFAATALASGFLSLDASSTQLEVDVVGTGVEVETAERTSLFGGLGQSVSLTTLSASGWTSAELLDGPRRATDPGSASVRLSASAAKQEGKPAGQLVVHGPDVPAKTRVRIDRVRTHAGLQMHMTVDATDSTDSTSSRLLLRASAVGSVEQVPPPEHSEPADVPVPIVIEGSHLDMDIAVADKTLVVATQVELGAVSFARLAAAADRNPYVVSSIESGTLTFLDVDNQERRLRAGDRLTVLPTEAWLRVLDLREEGMRIQLRGTAKEIRLGQPPRSIMPTRLAMVQGADRTRLAVVAALYAFGLLLGAFRWLRSPS